MTLAIAACKEAWNIGAHLHDNRRPCALTLAFVASACKEWCVALRQARQFTRRKIGGLLEPNLAEATTHVHVPFQ